MAKKARQIGLKELGKIIREEADKADNKDLKKAVADTDEIEADEYADTLEKPKDHLSDVELNKGLKEAKAKEDKAIRFAKSLRAKRLKLEARAKMVKLVAENKKLKAHIRSKRAAAK